MKEFMNYENSKAYYSKSKKYFLREYWDKNKNDLIQPNGFKTYPIYIYTFLSQEINKNGKVLDLGCGNGLMLKHLMQYSGYRLVPYGIEFLEKSIKQAKEIVHPQHKNNFLVGNIINYPFGKKFFDFIFISLHHIHPSDRKEFLKKMEKHTIEGGKIIFYAHRDVLKAHSFKSVNEFPEIKNWPLARRDNFYLSIASWQKK